jgi:response regulator RpfG family c-di-GMP phosphodiesterase
MKTSYEHHILIVDDEANIASALKRVFRNKGYQIHTALNGADGLVCLETNKELISLIISDQRMPGMSGSEFLEQAKRIRPEIIRILLTGYSDVSAIVDAVNKGEIHRYFTKPWNDEQLLAQVAQALEQYELVLENRRLNALVQNQNKQLYELGMKQKSIIEAKTLELEKKNKALNKSFIGTLRLLITFVDAINPSLGSYAKQTASLAKRVAKDCNVQGEALGHIEIAGLLHDIGLLGLPVEMITKDESELTEVETQLFHEHVTISLFLIQSVEKLKPVTDIVLHHHERYDGSGRPDGQKAEAIPLGARIIAAAGDYSKIVNFWPEDKSRMIKKARLVFGPEAIKNLADQDPAAMLHEIGERALLIGENMKYDSQIIAKLIKHIGEDRRRIENRSTRQVRVRFLEDGMVLANDLRTTDGKLLLSKEIVLDAYSIGIIKKLFNAQLIEEMLEIVVEKSRE